MRVIVPLGKGFEEIEAIAPVDILRRGGIEVITAYVDENPVIGSHNIPVTADASLESLNPDSFQMIFIPGGPGTKNLRNNKMVLNFVSEIYNSGGYVAAICAGPTVLGKAGILNGKNATCFPGCEDDLGGAIFSHAPYVVDGKVITGRGAGVAVPFGLQLLKIVKGTDAMLKVREAMQVYWQE